MRIAKSPGITPLPVSRALRKLGREISGARRRRRIPMQILAERASINRMTLNKIERGEPSVAMGSYATVLFALGLIDQVASIADPAKDPVGQLLEEERLPKRIRRSKKRLRE